MLKRISLVFMLLTALVGIVGVQAQTVAQPQSMAQYAPADSDVFFAVRTDGAFLDELSGVVNGVIGKLPDAMSAQMAGLDIKSLLEMQIGLLSETGIGDYASVSVSNIAVFYDQDTSNDKNVVVYLSLALSDRAKFEAFLEKMAPQLKKSDDNGTSVYVASPDASLYVKDDVAFITNQASFSGDSLASNSTFSDTIAKLPEPSYNFVVYANLASFFDSAMSMMPAQSMAMFDTLGVNLKDVGPIAVGGTMLDSKSLVIDSYTPAFGALMPVTAAIDPTFANNIPAGTSYVIQGTDLKASLNATIDLLYKVNDMQSTSGNNNNTLPSRKDINTQLKSFLGIDLDNDIIGWMGGNYALIGDANVKSLLDATANGQMNNLNPDLRFAFIVQGDGSDKPAKLVQTLGNLLIAQTKNDPSTPKIALETSADVTTVVIADVPLSQSPEIKMSFEMAANKDIFLLGDKTTVDAILSGKVDTVSGDASYVEAQKYILPNASMVAFADGEGWGNVVAVGIAGSAVAPAIFKDINAGLQTTDGAMPTRVPLQTNDLIKPVMPLIDAGYGIFSSSSLSVAYGADGSQLSRAVLTLK